MAPELRGFSYGINGGPAVPAHLRAKFDMADVIQDARLKVHHNAKRWKVVPSRSGAAYLKKAFASALADRIRHFDVQERRSTLERSLESWLDDSSARVEHWLAADQTSPSQRVSKEEQLLRLAVLAAILPVDQRVAVQLHHRQEADTIRDIRENEPLNELGGRADPSRHA